MICVNSVVTKCDSTEKYFFEVPNWNLKAETEMENAKVEKSNNELIPITIDETPGRSQSLIFCGPTGTDNRIRASG